MKKETQINILLKHVPINGRSREMKIPLKCFFFRSCICIAVSDKRHTHTHALYAHGHAFFISTAIIMLFQPARANSGSLLPFWISSTGNSQCLETAITHCSTSVRLQPWSNEATVLAESGTWCTQFRSSSPSPIH